MLDEKQIPETVFKMASSTFVAEVEASTLAIMAPRLDEGSPYFHTSSKSGHVAEMCNRNYNDWVYMKVPRKRKH